MIYDNLNNKSAADLAAAGFRVTHGGVVVDAWNNVAQSPLGTWVYNDGTTKST